MSAYICVTCGVQHAESAQPPDSCVICEDERQWVRWEGQRWVTPEEARAEHHTEVEEVEQEPGLSAIGVSPRLGIGQRALLVQTPAGNLLWDCLPLLDDAAVDAVTQRGGLRAIAISHPHFYGSCVDWSEAFGGVPIYIHAADRAWVRRPSERIVFWEGATAEPLPGLTLVHLGGHFDGAAVLHWAAGAGGEGAVLSGDTIQVVPDRRYVSFMYSYPNLIPLAPEKVDEIRRTMRGYAFRRLYGAFGGLNVLEGPDAVERSADRYIRHVRGESD